MHTNKGQSSGAQFKLSAMFVNITFYLHIKFDDYGRNLDFSILSQSNSCRVIT